MNSSGSDNTTVLAATKEEPDIALGLGLSIGLYVLVCVLLPLIGYVAFLWWKHDPFGLLFGSREYSVSSAGDKESGGRRRKKAITTVSVELGNRGSDHPPLYPMKEQTLPKKMALPSADERAESFVYTPPDTSHTSNGHQHHPEPAPPEPQVSLDEKVGDLAEDDGSGSETKVEVHDV